MKIINLRFKRFSQAICLLLVTLLFLWPLLWLLFGALWPDQQPLAAIWLTPAAFQPTLTNFITAWQAVPTGRFLYNSLRVVVLTVPLTLLTATLAAFAMSQLPARGQRLLAWASLATSSAAAMMAANRKQWETKRRGFIKQNWIRFLSQSQQPINDLPFQFASHTMALFRKCK